jgi:hypothetical protein
MSSGIPASELSDDDLKRELTHLHEKRHDIFLDGTAEQLAHHTLRMRELEEGYLRRFTGEVRDAKDKLNDL